MAVCGERSFTEHDPQARKSPHPELDEMETIRAKGLISSQLIQPPRFIEEETDTQEVQ